MIKASTKQNFVQCKKRNKLAAFILIIILSLMLTMFFMFKSHTHNIPVWHEYQQRISSTDELILEAKNVYFLKLANKKALYEKQCNEHISPASTTKLLAILTALDFCRTDAQVVIGDEIKLIAENSSRAWLKTGDILTVRQLFEAMLLPSGNDAAYALATFTGRSIGKDKTLSANRAVELFMDKMNTKAKDLGANNSNFITPDGYDTANQYTTAYDLAMIAAEFIENDLLRKISSSYSIYSVWPQGGNVTFFNTNMLLNPQSPYYMENAIGIKTGNSTQAGSCLISAAYIEDQLYLSVVMGSTEEGRFADTLKLYACIK